MRQGDIVANVFFPLTRPDTLKYLSLYNSGTDSKIAVAPVMEPAFGSAKVYAQSVVHGVVAHGAVLSQCCDVDRKHPKASFSLCRLIQFDKGRFKSPEALTANIDPWGPDRPHFQFFYLGAINGLEGEYLADFALLTSFGWKDYDLLLSKKVHQLDDLNRNKFRVKVGAFFGRPPDEDRLAGLANPYQPTAPKRPTFIERLRFLFRPD